MSEDRTNETAEDRFAARLARLGLRPDQVRVDNDLDNLDEATLIIHPGPLTEMVLARFHWVRQFTRQV